MDTTPRRPHAEPRCTQRRRIEAEPAIPSRPAEPCPLTRDTGPPDQPRALEARRATCRRRPEPGCRPHPRVLRIDAVRLHPHHLVRVLDRLRGREIPLRSAHDDRLATSDLTLVNRFFHPLPSSSP